MELKTYAKSLCHKAGKINLYVCFCSDNQEFNPERLKLEIEDVKQIIVNIENEIRKLQGG